MKLFTGKKPATHDARDLQFAVYRTGAALPPHPKTFGHEDLVTDWGMLGNDEVGDCVIAGGEHETMLWNAEAGTPVNFSRQTAIADYSAITGYDPNDPSTDQGTNVRDALNYRRHVGLVDAAGKRHKIAAFIALEPGNLEHIEEAMWLFGAVGIGIQFPESAMNQFNAGKPWSVVSGSQIDGGHYVPCMGVQRLGARRLDLVCITWGRPQLMTRGFFGKYCDEAFAILTEEDLRDGRTLEGFDLVQLKADLALLAA